MRVLTRDDIREEIVAPNVVQETRDYRKFKFLAPNRQLTRGHIESVKQTFESYGNLTRVQPILVNERFEVIDGQHRFEACKELGQPIYYMVVPGLGIAEARSMNILHRSWRPDDFALSYALSGDPNYIKYMNLKEAFGFPHTTMVVYIDGEDSKGQFKTFRNGDFVLEDEEGAVRRLKQLEEVGEYTPLAKSPTFSRAYLKIIQNPEYNHKHFISKLKTFGNDVLKRYNSREDNLRQIEELYNYKSYAKNRARLY